MSYHNKGTLFRGGKASRELTDFSDKTDLFDDFRFPNKKAIEQWAVLTVICLSIVAFMLGFFHVRAYWRSKELQADLKQGNIEIQKLSASKISSTLKENEPTTVEGFNPLGCDLMESIKERYDAQLDLLSDISRIIPSGAWLKRLVCKDKGVHRRKYLRKRGHSGLIKDKVLVEGYATSYREVMEFYTNLARLDRIHGCCLRYDAQEEDSLKFSISAEFFKKLPQKT